MILFMEVYLIGSYLKENRKRLKISQEELCYDLCEVSTLSRIERGLQIPSRNLVGAFFSKMGMTPPISDIPMKNTDFIRENLEQRIRNMIAAGRFEISGLLENYKECGSDMDNFEQQFYLFFKTLSDDFFQSQFQRRTGTVC